MPRTLPYGHGRTPPSDELSRLEAQLRAAFGGPAWHGPAILELLRDVTPEEAAAHPIAGAHSIWELVLHLTGTYGLVLRRIDGEARQLSPAEDWPPVPEPSDAAWRASIAELHARNRALRDAVLRFDAARLDQPLVAEPPYTAYEQFVGTTQHDLYHAGQMMLLKRAGARVGG